MKANNELLLHIYETSDMGIKSLTKLINLIKKKDNKIKKCVESELKEYECIYKSAKKELNKNKIKKIGPNILASMTANTAMMMEIESDNSDAKIADILLRGYTMGIIEIEKKIENYKTSTDKSIIKLAKKLLEFQKDAVAELKEFL